MQMKNVFAAVITTVAIMVTVSGCISNNVPTASPSPSPSATPTPQKQWPPSTIGTIMSSQVSIEDSYKDVKVSPTRDPTGMQSENISILFTNTGRTWANNTFVSLMMTDAQTGEYYFSGQFNVGNITPRSSQWINVSTGTHDFAMSVLLHMDYYWGDDLEFHNTFKQAYTIAPVQRDEVGKAP